MSVHGSAFLVLTDATEQLLPAAGRLSAYPVVGDFVTVENGMVTALHARRSAISRVSAGTSRKVQVLAANIDLLFIVSGLDDDFNLRRLERYVVLAKESGASPVFVLTKADLCPDPRDKVEAVRGIGGFPVILSSKGDGDGAQQMRAMITIEVTAALIGSSGAGKSTLLNLLIGQERQLVGDVREGDGKGRHTTTHRQMFQIPGGGWVVDQPGLREIQINADEDAVRSAFPEIEELAARCRFRDCRHESEPGCAVRGTVTDDRLTSFGKLRRESERAEEEADIALRLKKKSQTKAIHKAMRD